MSCKSYKSYKSIEPKEIEGNIFDMIGDRWMLITAKKNNDEFNAMTASWGGMGIMWGKPVASCVVRPVRYTYEFMEEAEYFTLTFFPEEYKSMLGGIFGIKSGRNTDKIKESGFSPIFVDIAGSTVKAIAFTEAEMIITCRKIYYQDINPLNFFDEKIDKSNYPKKDYHRMYFGEITGCLVK